jgi:hypothetical protein
MRFSATTGAAFSESLSQRAGMAPSKSKAFTIIAVNSIFPTNSGDVMHSRRKHEVALPQTAMDIMLDHLVRHRLTVFPALRRLAAFADWRPGQMKDLLREARKQGLVDSAPLHQRARYWYLESAGARRVSLSESKIGPLSEPAKFRAYALLRFCCLSETYRHRLMPSDLERHFPTAFRLGMPSGYYFVPSGTVRIGFGRVDSISPGRWDRAVQTLREDVCRHLKQPEFRRLIKASHFEITLLTVLPQKATRIRETLSKFPDVRGATVHVVAIPELLPLTCLTH